MAERFETFEVLIPASTAKANPQRTALEFADGIVLDIETLIPPGPSGLVGYRYDYGGQQVIPRTDGAFIVADGEIIRWPVSGYPTGQQWQIVAYNTDIFPHTLFVRMLIDEFRAPGTRQFRTVPVPAGG